MNGSQNFKALARFKRFGLFAALLTILALSADGLVHAGDSADDFSDNHTCVSCQLGQFVAPDGVSARSAVDHAPETVVPVDAPSALSSEPAARLSNPTRAPPA